MKMKINNIDLRNYAYDVLGYDTGTLQGLMEYYEWIEDLVLSPVKLQQIIKSLEK